MSPWTVRWTDLEHSSFMLPDREIKGTSKIIPQSPFLYRKAIAYVIFIVKIDKLY